MEAPADAGRSKPMHQARLENPMAASTTNGPAVAGLQLTLAVLASTKNEAAVGALLPALDSPYVAIQDGASEGHPRPSQSDRSARNSAAPARPRRPLAAHHRRTARPHVARAARRAVEHGRADVHQRLQCDVVVPRIRSGCALVTAAEDETNPNAELAARTLLALADLLYEELSVARDFSHHRDPQSVRRTLPDRWKARCSVSVGISAKR